ncbi:Spc24 subunit of Ndc80-domain-containing protein [Dipodascopsis uninucleata]
MITDNIQTLVTSTVSNFQIASDVQAVARIGDHIKILKSARDVEREQIHDILRSLSRQLELTKASVESASSPSKKKHAVRILGLDREKFTLAKDINDFESSYHTSEATLARLNEELEQLKADDTMVSESSIQQNSTILLLKVYRSLGINLESDGMGGYSKAIVRSQANKDIHVLPLDKTYSNFFIANYLWDMI